MKSYRIKYYSNNPFAGAIAEYYRQFPNKRDAKEWANAVLIECRYHSFKIENISTATYLQNID